LDLKPDNIMFDDDGNVQLIDFGMSRMIPRLHKERVLVGTPHFVAPEVIDGRYDKKADVWSTGILLFLLRFGYPPFFEENGTQNIVGAASQTLHSRNVLFERIQQGFCPEIKKGLGPWFPSDIPVSNSLQDLITKMLTKDLAKRPTAQECLKHPYFQQEASSEAFSSQIMDALTTFSGLCQFQVMVSKMFAHHIDQTQMKQLKECWDLFDQNQDGKLTLDQFKNVMKQYDHGMGTDIESMFGNLKWNEAQEIHFGDLLAAFSYQRLIAVDERLWEAFATLDENGDMKITTEQIKQVLKHFNDDEKEDDGFGANLFDDKMRKMTLYVDRCIEEADGNGDGEIDFEEFLSALLPREAPQSPDEQESSAPALKGDVMSASSAESLPSLKLDLHESLNSYKEYKHHKEAQSKEAKKNEM